MSLLDTLKRFDGKSTTELKEAASMVRDRSVAREVEEACASDDQHLRAGATWVVKHLVEKGRATDVDLEAVLKTLPTATEWTAQLHLLQIVQYAPEAAVDLAGDVRSLLTSPKAFVRVWAVDAFVRIAGVRPELLPEASSYVSEGLNSKAASMRVRCRNLQPLLQSASG